MNLNSRFELAEQSVNKKIDSSNLSWEKNKEKWTQPEGPVEHHQMSKHAYYESPRKRDRKNIQKKIAGNVPKLGKTQN